jgi:hypothetical protein
MTRITLILLLVAWSVVARTAELGPKLGPAETTRLQVGLIVKAGPGPCRGILATAPMPIDWPEQTVKIIHKDVTPHVKKLTYRPLTGAKQMLVEIPLLPAGEEARALVTLEITRNPLLPPDDPQAFTFPGKSAKDVRGYLIDAPYIESRSPKIRRLAQESLAGKGSAWEKVEALYDAAREKVQYRFGPLKGGLKALEVGEGDCEDISSLFIALCRASDIPARTVWVGRPSSGHCYPEFYLEDTEGKGHWIPCQAAGDRAFGSMPELRPILQKGDDFKIPEHRERQRYIAEHFRAADAKAAPMVQFFCEPIQ